MAAEAATVIQLLHFSGMVLSACYEYISKAKDAPKEIQRAIDEVSSLEGILKNLKPLAEAPEDDRFVILKSLNRTAGPFEACFSALKEVDKRLEALNRLPNVRRRLQWPLEAGKIEATIQKLGEHKISFILALAGQSAIDSDDMRKKIVDTKSSIDEIQARQLIDRMLSWLQGSDPSTNHNAAQKKKEAGTCEWLISSKQFQSFIEGENQLMWLHSIPGAGKTVLTSAVIDHLTVNTDLGAKKVIYYYFDFNDHTKQTCFGFLQSLVRQICAQSITAPTDIVQLNADCKDATPTAEQLIETLISLLSHESGVYIIIDALDECKEEDDEEERRAVLEALRDIKSSVGPCNIFVASRPEIDITREMTDLCDIDLDVQAALVDEDIRCHVRSCLAKDARLKRWPPNVKKEIEDKLTNDANGMFRWVVCQLTEIRKCLKLANLRLELGNLPKTLDATYARILKNVPSVHQREMRMILEFLTFSTRPMTLQEVAEATAVNLESQVFDMDDRFPDPYDLLAVCSSLVSISPVSEDHQSPIRREGPYRWNHSRMPADLRMLQFAHFSVKEYILSERAQQQLLASFVIGESLSHSHIAQTCLIYLLDFSVGKKISSFKHEEFPFLAYAALYWTSHLALASTDERDLIDALVVRLFDPENEIHLMNYLNLHDPDGPSRATISTSDKELRIGMAGLNKRDFQPPIYYACYHGLGKVVTYLLSGDEKTRPDKEALGSGLAAAASQGYSDTVELLLKHGADPNSPYSGKFWRPLHAAALSGNPKVVKQLLDAGSSVNSQSGHQGAALNVAAEQGNPEVLQLLIDHGAQLYPYSEYNGPPLSSAIKKQSDKAVKVLVKNNVDVNIPPDTYLNPLNLACTESSIEIVRLLLDNGAEAILKDPWNRALHNACERGAIDIMQLLIDRGADVNGDTNGVYTTPLKAAIQAEGRNIEVFDFMLRNGADINFRGSGVKYPLDQALFGGNLKAAERLIELGAKFGDEGLEEALDYSGKEYLAKMLIDRGANVNAEHPRYGNILQFAVLNSSATAVQWLLEAGSDPNDVPDGEYGTPLQAAANRGKEKIVRLLLDSGASVNPPRPSGEFGFPLHAAIWGQDEAIVELLLNHGADINVPGGKKSGTPLQLAAGAGSEQVVKSLIAQGAEINPAPNGEYGTPIRAALANCHEDIVQFLLENGADITGEFKAFHSTKRSGMVGEYYSSLELSAASRNPKLVQLLLDHGLEINSSGPACSRAILRASEGKDPTMLEFLIAKGADIKKYGGTALSLSIGRYDDTRLQKTQLLLKHGADPNGDGSDAMTPLASSIYHKQPEVMKLLLESGCDVNATYPAQYRNGSALHEAIDKVAIDVVKDLISRGADVNLRAGSRGTPLTFAITKGEEEIFRLLLEHGADIDPKTPYGYYGTPLQSAIQKDYYEIANELLDRGANPNAPGFHTSPLIGVCGWGKTGQIDLIERLLSAGADIEAEDKHRPEDDKQIGQRFYWTPLQYAAYTGKENIVELLLERGAKVNPSPPKGTHGYPLQAAVKNNNKSMVKLLLERGADINAVGGEFGTALQAAADINSEALVKLLLEAGADPKLEGGYYGSPLQAASRIGKDRHINTFLDLGAPINTNVGKYGNALAAACKRAHRSAVEILIARGANVNQPGGKYGYPLQAACCSTGSTAKNEAGSVVKILLEKGADINALGGKYGTALQAAAYHDRRYVQILLEHKADPKIRGGKFNSALSAARKKGFLRVEKSLLDHGADNEDVEGEYDPI